MAENLYVHFPFCRRKCRYCALYSRTGVSAADRTAYVRLLASQLRERERDLGRFSTVYFGGGSPALCDLTPLFAALSPHLGAETEFTVEVHPEDVADDLLRTLRAGGVNRLSMGVQSLDAATLTAMGRGYSPSDARRAFDRLRRYFENAGVDFIVGYPGDPCTGWETLKDWGLAHVSAYSLQNERNLTGVPDDDWTLDCLRVAGDALSSLGLRRYEISNYARPGFECRHNLAVWRGEDYRGLGEGACGREGLSRTRGERTKAGLRYKSETLSPRDDLKERTIFRLRTREGLDASRLRDWSPDPEAAHERLSATVREGLLTVSGQTYFLTRRGAEVCDAILADLV